MSLRLPSEIVVERFLPTARAMLATELHDRGFTQKEVADRLGLTQAAVSKYLRGDVTVEDRFAEDERMAATVEAIAEGFADGSMDGYEALSELLDLVRVFEDRGPICAVHEEEMPALDGLGCDLCVRGTDDAVLAEREALAAVRRAARRIANEPGMAEHVPNVGTNVGTAVPDAADPTDVAAVPGRLQAVNGRVVLPADPEFGASQRVAETIRAATAVDPETRGALNLATSEGLLAAARDRGIDPLAFDADYEERGERLRERFRDRGAVPRVAYHEGAFGIEPVTYVFGETATEAAALAVDLAESARTE
ncbi:HTH DNA-binding protein [Halosimplex carlsbadense 2-9-1]|uniref:HTH DNA-binding protein n=1 Tax=Halosimplex carlsbadense 2-9-1 TaxID=797114 RepID=M0CEH2_9EURY|nr:thiamine-phosphate synthase family protein [Halosimplex carlsbadense]ELZ20284.1 HTH DNA-binding protein [Halosimplex carlsbadense 2-9-1]